MFWDHLLHRRNWLEREIYNTLDYYIISYQHLEQLPDKQSTEYRLAELDCLVTKNMLDTWITLKTIGKPLSKGQIRVQDLKLAKTRLSSFGKVTGQRFESDLLPYAINFRR